MTIEEFSLPIEYRHPPKLLEMLKKEPEEFWLKRGDKRVLKLFHLMADRVPAYKDFLKNNQIDPATIKTVEDLKRVPTVDKDNYLRKYPLKDLCWDGDLSHTWHVFSATSGSTGEPFYFPRSSVQDTQYAVTAEMYLLNNFDIDKKTTLYIDGFAMGAWIGGLFTYQAIKNVSESRKYPINIITPGLNKEEIIKAVKNLGPNYDQVILGAYPPFAKDVIDEGIHQGLDWKKYNIKFIFSAEAFSETFRDYVAEHTGLQNIYLLNLNHYGTVDQGTLAHETPLSVLVRRIAVKNPSLYKDIFSDASKLPTLAQFLPEMFYFEIVDGREIICSSFSGLPLVRYDLKDHGGVLTLKQMKDIFAKNGLDIDEEVRKVGLEDKVMNLPFVYVYERADLSVSLSGANIYPEPVRNVLHECKFQESCTGKFTMLVVNDENQNPHLEVNVELKRNIQPSKELTEEIQAAVVNVLVEENSEYRSQYEYNRDRATPQIVLWPYEHDKYFCLKGKQKWVIK